MLPAPPHYVCTKVLKRKRRKENQRIRRAEQENYVQHLKDEVSMEKQRNGDQVILYTINVQGNYFNVTILSVYKRTLLVCCNYTSLHNKVLDCIFFEIITCTSPKAFYLCLAIDCPGPTCVNMLKRYTNIFGPKTVISDNGMNFVSSDVQECPVELSFGNSILRVHHRQVYLLKEP